MIITPELAMPVVLKLKPVISYGINIIDHDSVIVASTDSARVGTVHQGSKLAMSQNKEILVYQDNDYKGTKTGVTLPIQFLNGVAGAIGITGNPDEVYKTACIIKITVESLLLQEFMARQALHKTRMVEEWASALFEQDGTDIQTLEAEAARLNIDITAHCAVIVIAFRNQLEKTKPLDHSQFLVNETLISGVVASAFRVNFAAYMGHGHFAVAVFRNRETLSASMTAIIGSCESVSAQLDDRKLFNYIGAGPLLAGLEGFRQSYAYALQSLALIEKLNYPKKTMYIHEWQILMLLHYVPDDAKISFIEHYWQNKPRLSGDDRAMLETYFENDKNLNTTSAALHIHKNTLLYHLSKINKIYNLDPKKFYDSMLLQILIYMERLIKG